MNVEQLYSAYTIVITLAWLLLIAAPRWTWTEHIVHRIWMPLAIVVWVVALSLIRTEPPAGATMTSMQGVMLLTNGPEGTLILWTLVMGWDLLAGAWLSRDAQRHGIHHAWVVASLIATYFLGIAGFALYLIIRWVLRRVVTFDETLINKQPVIPRELWVQGRNR